MEPNTKQDKLYEEACRSFGGAIQRLAHSTEAHPERRHDLLQDMHFALWRSFSGFDGRCSLKTWIYRVIHNTAASYVSREMRDAVQSVDMEEIANMADPVHTTRYLEKRDALARLHEQIRHLKNTDRQVIMLYLEGLSAAEIAEIVGLSSGAVATRISRLKPKLTQNFKESVHDET